MSEFYYEEEYYEERQTGPRYTPAEAMAAIRAAQRNTGWCVKDYATAAVYLEGQSQAFIDALHAEQALEKISDGVYAVIGTGAFGPIYRQYQHEEREKEAARQKKSREWQEEIARLQKPWPW